MKIYSYLLLGAMFLLGGCSDLLDIDPKNKIPADELFSTPEGVQAHMANLYGRLPIEDFTYSPNRGFNVGVGTDVNNAGLWLLISVMRLSIRSTMTLEKSGSIIGKTVINSFVI